jgi:hypothetical protein
VRGVRRDATRDSLSYHLLRLSLRRVLPGVRRRAMSTQRTVQFRIDRFAEHEDIEHLPPEARSKLPMAVWVQFPSTRICEKGKPKYLVDPIAGTEARLALGLQPTIRHLCVCGCMGEVIE